MPSKLASSCSPIVSKDRNRDGTGVELGPMNRACNGERAINHRKVRGLCPCSFSGLSLALRGNVSETIHMKFKHILGLLCAASISVLLAANASAQDKTVKIGAIFPLSGNAASAGVHAKAAIETAIDIINNAHPELGNFPLAKNAGLAGLGGAKVEVVFADNQGSPATGQN